MVEPRDRHPRPLSLRWLALVVGAVVVAACASGESGDGVGVGPAPAPFVVPTDAGPGPDGAVLAVAEIPPPDGLPARAWRLAYRMPGIGGGPAVATAMLVVPTSASSPADPAALVVWAHPTRGSADPCAPSAEGPATITLLGEALAQGWAVVAPDYEGLGAPGPHPYLVGASEGRSVLWSAVAAQQVPAARLGASTPVVLWGFSQGGHAAAHAAQMAPTETPALDLWAVAVAAPVSDVTHFSERAERRSDQLGVLVTIVAGFVAAYPEIDPTAVLTADAWAGAGLLEEACIGEVVAAYDRPVAHVSAAPVTADPAMGARLAENQAGTSRVDVPVLVVQGTDDDIVDPADTSALVDRWCALGVAVDHVERPGASHGVPVEDLVVPWLADRLRGRAITGSCPVGRAPAG